jgi:serine protease Do
MLLATVVGAYLFCSEVSCGQTISSPASASTANEVAEIPHLKTSAMTREQMFAHLAAEADKFEGQHRLISQLVKVVRPTIAHIEAKKRSPQVPSSGSNRKSTESVVEEAGSGVVIERNKRFYVITNFHVIDGASLDDIRVEVDGRYYTPIRLFHDRDTDLSVISLSQSDLIPAHLGDSADLDIGEFVVAVGSPFGLSKSVSFGIVSALERNDLELGPTGVRYQDFIQTDAAINPGNSGGPLINLRGEIVGINTAIASNGGGSDGIGFAIPINMTQRIVNDLIDHGEVRRGFLGVTLDARYNYLRARELGLDLSYGALVSALTPNSPASEAGLQIGDVILEFDNQRVVNDSQLVTRVSLAKIDSRVPVKIYRNGQFRLLSLTIKNRRDVDWRSP